MKQKRKTEHILCTYKKNFYVNPPVCNQYPRVWAGRRKADVEQEKFASHVTVSAAVCVGRQAHLYFQNKKAKVIAAYHLERLLPELVEDCEQLLQNGFIFQQDGAPAYVTHDWLKSNDDEDKWPPIHSISIHWTIVFVEKSWSLTISCSQSQKQYPSWKTRCNWSGLPCRRQISW